MRVHSFARILYASVLALSVLGAYMAVVWHEALFHAPPESCGAHPDDHDHDHGDEDHHHEGEEQCLLCDFFFYYDMPGEGLKTLSSPIPVFVYLVLCTEAIPLHYPVDAPPLRGPPCV
jgi:hypothetical protein